MIGFCWKKISILLKHSEKTITPASVIRREEIQSRQVSNNSNPDQKYYGAWEMPTSPKHRKGETGRCLQDRINEHKKNVRKKNERSNIYQHVRNTAHEFKFEEVNF